MSTVKQKAPARRRVAAVKANEKTKAMVTRRLSSQSKRVKNSIVRQKEKMKAKELATKRRELERERKILERDIKLYKEHFVDFIKKHEDVTAMSDLMIEMALNPNETTSELDDMQANIDWDERPAPSPGNYYQIRELLNLEEEMQSPACDNELDYRRTAAREDADEPVLREEDND